MERIAPFILLLAPFISRKSYCLMVYFHQVLFINMPGDVMGLDHILELLSERRSSLLVFFVSDLEVPEVVSIV